MAAKADDKVEGVREQDKFLPIANISRIMKEALPQNAKISKDAKELVQQCVSDFIIFITSEASDKCQREKRKTVNGDDILWAMKSLGFEDAVVVLSTYLQKIREAEGAEKSAKSAAAESRDGATGTLGATNPNPGMVPGAAPPGYVTYAPMPMQGVPGQQERSRAGSRHIDGASQVPDKPHTDPEIFFGCCGAIESSSLWTIYNAPG
eukprot:jgi/Ulvmu1/4816/UM020_0101.1